MNVYLVHMYVNKNVCVNKQIYIYIPTPRKRSEVIHSATTVDLQLKDIALLLLYC